LDFNTVLTYLGTWTIGSLTLIDLIAATTNAFNGTILAHRRDHRRAWTTVGIILIAVLGGIGGGVARDVLLNDVPSALTNPWYLILCVLAAALSLQITRRRSLDQVRRIFDFMAAFSLPWYAIIGAQKALAADLPLIAVVLIGCVGPTAGRYFIDVTSSVTPQQFTRGEWFIGTAVLTVVVYIILDALGLSLIPATLLAWLVGFGFRLTSLRLKWEEPEPWHEEVRAAGATSAAAG
jgi:uncharacterized membrane protein YeiH